MRKKTAGSVTSKPERCSFMAISFAAGACRAGAENPIIAGAVRMDIATAI